MSDYRVNLDIYNGPMDLLLYLIRREEVDIHDIPIARITEQYVRYVEALRQVDPNLAGEFLVLAATLMEIKTRLLLPTAPPEEGGEDGLGLDPRAELIRQLLEYKTFKDAAGELGQAAAVQAMKLPRRPGPIETGPAEEVNLEDVQVWDLLDAFSRMMASIGSNVTQQEVIYDETPVELHAADIVDRLQREGPLTFSQIFEGRTTRSEIVGLFLALLELVRQTRLIAAQKGNFGDISLQLNPESPPTEAEPLGQPSEAAPQAAGRYVGEYPAGPDESTGGEHDQPDDDGMEAEGTGV